jgi:subtilisin family serine protease
MEGVTMYSYNYGGKTGSRYQLEEAEDLLVVRTKQHKSIQDAVKSVAAKKMLSQLIQVAQIEAADVTVLQCRTNLKDLTHFRDLTRSILKKEEDILFAGRVLREQNKGKPVIYTENLFVKFSNDIETKECEQLLSDHLLTLKKKIGYAVNAYFVGASQGTGLNIFQLANTLLKHEKVDLCHPELVKQVKQRAAAPQQWHLKSADIGGNTINAHVQAEQAWLTSKGENIIIAVIDDGVDISHEEFSSVNKIVAPRDSTLGSNDPNPKFSSDNHGTACAGVACADGNYGASGVAPKAKLMPIRLRSGLGSQAEADAFEWAADFGADVISCSWGPADGEWWNANDTTHNIYVGLPDSTRLAIDYAINTGRGGKGCVITWAAGNGNENVENDGYASYNKVIAVAACNDSNTRSIYSDFGESVWCSFPSSDFGHSSFNHPSALTSGIWTTDREGQHGYNPGELNPNFASSGDGLGHYTESFGGTSSACPGVAGIAALILSANPLLTWSQVKTIFRQSCVKIDVDNGNYDSSGHSPLYGYGRADAAKAVALAKPEERGAHIEILTLSAQSEGQLDGVGAEKGFKVWLSTETKVTLDGPGGIDFDLYVKKAAMPTVNSYDWRAYTATADETLQFIPDSAGDYYIMVRSYQGAGSFRLVVELV